MKRRTSQAVAARLTWILLRVTHFMTRSFRRRGQVVELDDRIGLRPDAKLARLREGLVMGIDDLLSVEEDLEVVALRLHCQLVPFPRGHLPVPARELPAVALDHVVEADVVLERVRTGHVVVVGVLQAEDQATTLVTLSGDRLALHGEPEVLQLWPGVR